MALSFGSWVEVQTLQTENQWCITHNTQVGLVFWTKVYTWARHEPTTTDALMLFLRSQAGHLSLLQLVVAWQDLFLESSSSFTTKTMCLCVPIIMASVRVQGRSYFDEKKTSIQSLTPNWQKVCATKLLRASVKKSKSTWCFWLYFLLWKHESNFKMPKTGSQGLGGNSQRNVFFPTLLCIAMTMPISGEQWFWENAILETSFLFWSYLSLKKA